MVNNTGTTNIRRKRRQRRRGTGSGQADSVGKYASDAWSLAKRTMVGLNEIRKLINVEEKLLVTSTVVTPDTAGGVYAISRLGQGTDINQRVGDSIKLQRITLSAYLALNASATATVARILLVRDLDGYGTQPTTANILESVSVNADPKFLNRERFSILIDEKICLATAGPYIIPIDHVLPHEGHIKYLGSSAAEASDGKGSLYLCYLSTETTNKPSLTFSSVIYYTDD